MSRASLLVPIALLCSLPAFADEGMWTFDAFPSERVKERYGFLADAKWLEHVRLAAVRVGRASGSLVSPDGLVMTNHHVARGCVEDLSTAKRDLIRDGFLAARAEDERTCPGLTVDQLVSIDDVTARVQGATAGLSGEPFRKAQEAEIATIEQACAAESVRCEVVTLYNGGRYSLYRSRRFSDVRLVFAPEEAIAFFGGDPDNFEFPRYDLDLAFLRVYESGRAAKTPTYYRWSEAGVKEGELTFVPGNPGATQRLLTISELVYERDVALPERLEYLAELRGTLTQFARSSAEAERTSKGLVFGVENGFKARAGRREALVEPGFLEAKVKEEQALVDRVSGDSSRREALQKALADIERAMLRRRELRRAYAALETDAGFRSELVRFARTLVRGAAERSLPNTDRLPEFGDARLAEVELHLGRAAPIHAPLEELLVGAWLTKVRERLGMDHPATRALLGKESPEAIAKRLVRGTTITSPAARLKLWRGGAQALAGAKDPLLAFVAAFDGEARRVRRQYTDEVEAVVRKAHEVVAAARFAAWGTTQYPDATSTPRLSYGSVEGYVQDGKRLAPFTLVGGAFERATGTAPFALPPSWLAARRALDPATPFNFVTSNDIIGGNSGSPVIDREARIVGLVFDGNRQSLGGEFGFDPRVNRTVAVHSMAMLETLGKVYRAERIVRELLHGR